MPAIYAAATAETTLNYDLTCEDKHVITVPSGAEITVAFRVENKTEDENFKVGLFQNEVFYDHEFFEFLGEENIELVSCSKGELHVPSNGKHLIYLNDMRTREYEPSQLVATFKLKVTATEGKSTISSLSRLIYDENSNEYTTYAEDLTVVVGSGDSEESEVFTITYYDNDKVFKKVVLPSDESFELVDAPPAPDGYNFVGWKNGDKIYKPGDEQVAASDMVFNAVWEESNPIITLTFDSNGGSNISPVTGEKGSVISLADYTPTRSGYTFNGWYSDSELTEKVESIELTEDTTVYAKWTKKSENPGGGGGGGGGSDKIEISFETNGGEIIDSVYVLEKATVDLTKYVPEKDGFKFEGWFADENFTKPVEKIIAEKDVTVYAKWSAIDDGKNDKEDVTDGKENTDKEDGLDGGNNTPAILTDKHFAYIVGRDDGYIRPKANLTRAEAATIFFRLLNDEVRNEALTKENSFNDVNENNWFNTAVSTLAKLGIINGRTASEFAPAAPITRAELTTIVARMSDAKYEGKNLFDDIDNHWAENYINVAASNKWIEGDGNGLFRPNDNITRAEVMVLINRVLGRLPESKDDLLEGMTEWPDNADESAWYYIAIQEATNSHDYDYKEDGVHEQWTKLTDNPDWSAFEN